MGFSVTNPIEKLVSELDELARHAPGKLTERLASMSVVEQADLALRLEPTQRLTLLLHAPKPMRLVRALPAPDWYITVREIGPADATDLIKLASADQLIHLFDLEAWRIDRFDADRAGAWLAVVLGSGEPAVRRFLQHADEELLALLCSRWLRIEPLEFEDGADRHGHGLGDQGTAEGMTSPDGNYRFSPTIKEHSAAAHCLLQLFYVEHPERYQRAVWASLWELPAELEELAHQWKRSRLEEYGFPDWEEALNIYAPPSESRGTAGIPAAIDRDGLAASRRALMPSWGRSSLVAAADLLDGDERERVLHEAAALANRILIADGADPGELEHHRAALAKMIAFLGIALDQHAGAGPEVVAKVLGERSLVELFREGWSRATTLQRRAADLVSHGWGIAHPDPLRAIDPPLDERLRALLEKRPRYVEVSEEALSGTARDFRSREELEETAVAVEMAERIGNLLFGKLGWAPGPDDDPHRLSTLFLTSLARLSVDGDWKPGPLEPRLVADFLRTVGSRRTAAPEAASRALEKMIRLLTERHELEPRDISIASSFGRFALERLAGECAGLDPGVPPDPRFVNCLLLE